MFYQTEKLHKDYDQPESLFEWLKHQILWHHLNGWSRLEKSEKLLWKVTELCYNCWQYCSVKWIW